MLGKGQILFSRQRSNCPKLFLFPSTVSCRRAVTLTFCQSLLIQPTRLCLHEKLRYAPNTEPDQICVQPRRCGHQLLPFPMNLSVRLYNSERFFFSPRMLCQILNHTVYGMFWFLLMVCGGGGGRKGGSRRRRRSSEGRKKEKKKRERRDPRHKKDACTTCLN